MPYVLYDTRDEWFSKERDDCWKTTAPMTRPRLSAKKGGSSDDFDITKGKTFFSY